MLGEQHHLDVGVGADRLGDELREREAGADVGNPDGVGAEALPRQRLAVACTDDRTDRVWVGVIDVGVGDEGVQQRLDRRARHRRVELTACEVGDHLLVAHRVALEQRHDLVEAQAGEAGGGDRSQVAARPLDPQDVRLASGVVGLAHLDGGVAAPKLTTARSAASRFER